jgi:hypothetical protein
MLGDQVCTQVDSGGNCTQYSTTPIPTSSGLVSPCAWYQSVSSGTGQCKFPSQIALAAIAGGALVVLSLFMRR